MSKLLLKFPEADPPALKTFLKKHFSLKPQLVGGNHTTAAVKRIIQDHYDGSGEFRQPLRSNLDKTLIGRFLFRRVLFLVSPVPFEDALETPRIVQGLLAYSRVLNDHAKSVKKSTLNSQLLKIRQALANFLLPQSDLKAKLKAGGTIWPNSHAEFSSKVYSKRGIVPNCTQVVSAEFQSSVSHLKQICLCPEETFTLFLEITQHEMIQKKQVLMTPVVNSTKNLVNFTLAYCELEELNRQLLVISALVRKGKPVLAPIVDKHKEYVRINKVLDWVATDLTEGPEKNEKFSKLIGKRPEQGLFLEPAFKAVCFLNISN